MGRKSGNEGADFDGLDFGNDEVRRLRILDHNFYDSKTGHLVSVNEITGARGARLIRIPGHFDSAKGVEAFVDRRARRFSPQEAYGYMPITNGDRHKVLLQYYSKAS